MTQLWDKVLSVKGNHVWFHLFCLVHDLHCVGVLSGKLAGQWYMLGGGLCVMCAKSVTVTVYILFCLSIYLSFDFGKNSFSS